MVLNNSQKYKTYNNVAINTSTQEALILKCYNGVLGCLRFSRANIEDRHQWPQVNREMIKAQKGIGLLASAVKDDSEIGQNLLRLYDFIMRYIMEANIKKDPSRIDEMITMVEDMKEAWEKAFNKLHHESSSAMLDNNRKTQGPVLNIVG